jgi:uracil-DNA glycosylase family 4
MYHPNPDLEAVYLEAVNKWPDKDDKFVPAAGPAPCNIMFVGEAPGPVEVASNSIITGKVATYFDKLLGLSGVNREDVFVTNAVKFYKKNRVNREGKPSTKPDARDRTNSLDTFRKELKIVKPKLIVTMGSTPLSFFFSMMSIGEARKEIREKSGYNILCTYHPAMFINTKQRHIDERLQYDFKLIGNYLRSIN